MKKLYNKKLAKATILRLIIVCAILLADITLVPWILKLPPYLVNDFVNAPNEWMQYGLINSIKDIFTDPKFRNLYFVIQIPVLALIIGVAWDVNRLRKRNRITDGVGGPEPAGQGQFGTSRWQDKHEMDFNSNVWYTGTPIKKGGIIYGMEKSANGREKVWYNSGDLHTLIIAATRSGKSRKIILPSIWKLAQTGESMVLGDPKGELYISSYLYLKSQGYNVITLNIREPLKGNQWNMLDLVNKAFDAGDIPRTTELAWDIAHTFTNQTPSVSSEPIWKNGAESTIAALILLTVMNSEFKFQRHMTTAYYLLSEYGQPLEDESIPLLDYIKSLSVKHPAKSAFATASIAPYKTRASFFTTVLSDLRLFGDPNISDMTSKQDHDLESVGIEKTAVFLITPDEKSTRNVLATLYVDQLYQSLVDLANKRGGRIPRRVNIILDEFGNLPPLPDFDKKITVGGGRGIRFTLVLQDIAQLKKLYDKNSQTITGNCHTWIYLKTADIETAKLISEKTGKYTVETENSSSSLQPKSHSLSHGVSTTGRPLLMTDEVLRWNIDESLVLPISHFPVRYPLPDLSFWKANNDYGFVKPSGDVDTDSELNRRIIEKRWNEVPQRNLEETNIWLPDLLSMSNDDEKGSAPYHEEPITNRDPVIDTHSNSTELDIQPIDIQPTEIQPTDVSFNDMERLFNEIDDMLKDADNQTNDADTEENFL